MTLFTLLFLAIIQGLTEFLPISSSAHLVLLHEINGTGAEGLALDVAVHLGSILAVIGYFRTESVAALRGLGHLARGHVAGAEARLALNLIVATIPLILAGGLVVAMGWSDALRNITVIGWAMIGFGLLLWMIDRRAPQTARTADWTLRQALVMGLWQVLALIPGTSRAGITITGARALGMERHDAARIAMLMSIPALLAAGAILGIDVARSDAGLDLLWRAAVAALFAFGAAWLALSIMMRFLDRVSFTPYVIYRVILGVVLLGFAYA